MTFSLKIAKKDILLTDGYHLGATLKRPKAAEAEQVASAIISKLLALKGGKRFSVTLHVLLFGQLRTRANSR